MTNTASFVAGQKQAEKAAAHAAAGHPGATILEFTRAEIEGSIPARFERVADHFSERIAVKDADGALAYWELNQAANRLARAIRAIDAQGEEAIALLLGPGSASIVAVLGILKAGRMYLPLDSSFPPARIEYMLEDSQARLVITNRQNLALARKLAGEKVRCLNLDELEAGLSGENLDLEIPPERLAAMFYTSGSTGKAKGVLQDHRNLLHSAWVNSETNQYVPEDRIALLFSLSFAASCNSMFGALLNGASLLPFDAKTQLHRLPRWLIEEEITIYGSVSTLFRQLGAILTGKEEFPHLRMVSLGGETVLKQDFEIYRKYFPSTCKFRIGLGGTEMLVVRGCIFDKDYIAEENVMPVGYPMPDKEVLLVDESGAEVEVGQVGEIVVRSPYLSPGYWRRPELTREKFVEVAPGVRQYASGDLGRLAPDGCLHHLGRKDFQVKIRGYRIELGEIESVLMEHPAIREATVVVDAGTGGENRLVAYLVGKAGEAMPSMEEWRLYARKRLPDYMVPFAFVVLDEFPLTPTGKVDRRALPNLAEVLDLEKEYVAPRDELERELTQIWGELLGVSPIGIRNDFFKIGGHSLLAAGLIARVEERYGLRVDLAALAGGATVEGLAEALRAGGWSGKRSRLVVLRGGGDRPPLFCAPGVGGHVLAFRELAESLGAGQPVFGLQSRGLDGSEKPESNLEAIAAEYIREMRKVQPKGPYYLGGFSFGGYVAYEMARQLQAAGEEVGLVAILDAQAGAAPGFERGLTAGRRARYRVRSLLKKYGYHLKNLAGLKPGEMIAYLKKAPDRPNQREAIFGDAEEEDYEKVPKYLKAVMAANGEALRKYVPKRYRGKVTVFKSRDHGRGVYYGWEELAEGGVEEYEVPGNHRGILQEPNVQILARQIRACIDRTLSAPSSS